LIVFVRSDKDVLLYALVTVVGTAGNYIVNIFYSSKFIKFTLNGLNLTRHIKSIIYLVAVNLAIELYSLVDITMMSFMSGEDNIAFYKYGKGIEAILLHIVNTFTMIIVPRISFYYKENKISEYNRLLSKGLKLVILCGLPMIIGLYFTADFFMVALYGEPLLHRLLF
jgi:O-antigen/teichoic acid export membrane protein